MAILRPCRNTAAFEVIPDRKVRLNLAVVEQELSRWGYRRVVRAGVLLIMRPAAPDASGTDEGSGVEASVFRSGKMLLKTRDPDAATALAERLLAVVLPPEEAGPLRTEDMHRMAPSATAGGA